MTKEEKLEFMRQIGSKGGKARKERLTPEERTQIALKAVWIREYIRNLKKKNS